MEITQATIITPSKGVAFVRNSDVRYDTRLRKAVYEAIECGLSPYFFGWIRDGGGQPCEFQEIHGRQVRTKYFMLQTRFGLGLKNIFRLIAFNVWLLISLVASRKQYDTIYVCDLDVAFPALIIKLIFRKSVIYDIFDFYAHTHSMPKVIKKFVESAEYTVCRASDAVIVCTEKRAESLRAEVGIEPVIVYNTPNLAFRPKAISHIDSGCENSFCIVYVGTLPATSRLLYEITEKIKTVPEVDLYVAGAGPLETYFRETSRVFNNVHFYGQITNEEALALQARADILFATYDPSLEINRNSAPNKVYEAMALGKPIIVCRNTDADSVVTSNECGYAIEYDASAFMDVVDRYRNNVVLRTEHGSNGLKLYQSSYGWSICRDRLRKLFHLL